MGTARLPLTLGSFFFNLLLILVKANVINYLSRLSRPFLSLALLSEEIRDWKSHSSFPWSPVSAGNHFLCLPEEGDER